MNAPVQLGLAFGSLLGVLAAASCDGNGGPPADVADPPQGLTLLAAQPDHMEGTYVEGDAVLRFAAVQGDHAARVTLRDRAGSVLLEELADKTTGAYTLTILDGRLKQVISEALIKNPIDSTERPSDEEFRSEGDIEAIAELRWRAEHALLPAFSFALGDAGLDGRNFPAALLLHRIALRAAQSSPDLADIQSIESGRKGALAPGSSCYIVTCPNGTKTCLGSNGCEPGAGSPVCPHYYGVDLRSDPCRNGCYGMCGLGCTCWSHVCGNCRYNVGCAQHDDWCRACSWAAPWYCAMCYSPLALSAYECRLY